MQNKITHPTAFSYFFDSIEHRHQVSQELSQSRKLIGYFCDFVPEEILDAAGFVPIRILGTRKPISLAEKHLQSNVCSFARSCLELVLDGTYGYMSGMVIPHSCDVITKMNDLLSYRAGFLEFCHYLWYPHKVSDPAARAAFIDEVLRLKTSIEEYTRSAISEESIQASILSYNENRRLLKQIYQLRKDDPPAITGEEAFSLTLSSLLIPKEEHNIRLKRLFEELPKRTPLERKSPRILVSAAVLDDFELIRAVEGLGGVVVMDDSCTGIRSFWDEVRKGGNPIEAIAERYLQKIPCPRTFDSGGRIDFLMKNIGDYKVDGVIIYILRCCDAHLFQLPGLLQKLKLNGVPALYLQGDRLTSISEETKNRIAAFIEMLGGK